MLGNVLQWTDNWYVPNYASGTAVDPMGPANGETRVLRGGSWSATPRRCRCARRFNFDRNLPRDDAGFRVVLEVDNVGTSQPSTTQALPANPATTPAQ